MHKKIILSLLLITSTATHGMKRPNNIQNNDAVNNAITTVVGSLIQSDFLPQITIDICRNHNYQPCDIRKGIRTLSNTNKIFHDYYAQEKVKQELIGLCVLHNDCSHRNVARDLKCHEIYTKIKNLTKIVRNKKLQFSEEDLKDPWYLNITTTHHEKTSYNETYNKFKHDVSQSLLYLAIDNWNLEAAIAILDHAKELHFQYGENQNPLLQVAKNHGWLEADDILLREQNCDQLLVIAQKLLKKGILPDGQDDSIYTPLICAVSLHDKKLTRLLIEHHANPYLVGYNQFVETMKNAFSYEPKKGWLQKIIDEVNQAKTVQSQIDQSVVK